MSIEIAFKYYVLLVTMLSYFNNEEYVGEQTSDVKQQLQSFYDAWSKIRGAESFAFSKFFGSIEIIAGDNLRRIYFPVPRPCREQMKNPLVKQEMTNLLDNVKRDNPEEKLDDFLDRSLGVQAVIEHQQSILSGGRFSGIIRFLTMNESKWVYCAYIVTLMINFILLWNVSAEHSVDNFYLPEQTKNILFYIGFIHLFFALVLGINYFIGTARVTINSGMQKRIAIEEGLIANPYTGLAEVLYKAAGYLPDLPWKIWFLVTDPLTFYYIVYVILSIMGIAVSPAWFAFHVLDATVRVKLLNYVLRSVTVNYDQVLGTLFLGLLLVYLYAVVGYNAFGWNVYAYGDSPDSGADWTTLSDSFWEHFDFGLRGPPTFDDGYDNKWKFVFSISYNILIILIMVAIITGIIIDTFGEMRAERNEISDDQNNNCFICSLPREVFERHRVQFSDHVENHHNPWFYLYYKMYLEQKDDTELTGVERTLKDQMARQLISYFPVGRALAIPVDDEEEEVVEQVQASMKEMGARVDTLSCNLSSVSTRVDSVQGTIEEIRSTLSELADTLLAERK
jgi:hypothetical protein